MVYYSNCLSHVFQVNHYYHLEGLECSSKLVHSLPLVLWKRFNYDSITIVIYTLHAVQFMYDTDVLLLCINSCMDNIIINVST